MNILAMHSSIRRPLSRSHTVSPQYQSSEPSESELSRQNNPDQEQFINGQPTASLNGQHPSIVRTFSRSTRIGQYEAETTPNIAYIERTSSIGTASLRSHGAETRLQVADRLNVEGRMDAGRSSKSNPLQSAYSDVIHPTFSRSTQTSSLLHERCTMSEPGSVRQSGNFERLLQQREAIPAPFIPDTSFQNGRGQQPSIAQVLAAASENEFLSEANCAHSDVGLGPNTHPRRRPAPYDARSRFSRLEGGRLMTRSMVDGVDDRGGDVVEWLQRNVQDHEPIAEEGDYFGDSIAGEEDLSPPVSPRDTYRTRSSTPEIDTAVAARLVAANPDPPRDSTTKDDLPPRTLPLGIAQPEPSYRSRRPIEPISTSYPNPLRPQSSASKGEVKESTPPSVPPLGRASRKARYFPTIQWKYNRDRRDGGEDQGGEDAVTSSLHSTAPSHWAFYIIQGFIWLALSVYLFWRVSKLEKTVSFDCYDLKMNLLHLVNENVTLPLINSTASNITSVGDSKYSPTYPILYTLADKYKNASSVIIPQEFHAKLKANCILEPVNPAIVLASYFEVLFIMTLVTCGLAHMLQLLVLQQLRSLMQKSGALGTRTLVIRVAVHVIVAGLASFGVVGAVWGIKGGSW